MDVILQTTMFACILHNLLTDQVIPQDWMVDSTDSVEKEEADCWEQILAYMLEMR